VTDALPPAAAAPAPARPSGLLLASLALSGLSILALARPPGLGPGAPFVAGLLAFLGDRAVRTSGGAVRGPRLARVAMTLALALFVHQGWMMIRHAPTAAARAAVAERIAAGLEALRSGTPESAWELLGDDARRGADRERFVAGLRAALADLGPLADPGAPEEAGDGWGSGTASFLEGASARRTLRVAYPAARFARGTGRIEIAVEARRDGRRVGAELLSIAVEPARTPR
jgi:hypothetical protein